MPVNFSMKLVSSKSVRHCVGRVFILNFQFVFFVRYASGIGGLGSRRFDELPRGNASRYSGATSWSSSNAVTAAIPRSAGESAASYSVAGGTNGSRYRGGRGTGSTSQTALSSVSSTPSTEKKQSENPDSYSTVV